MFFDFEKNKIKEIIGGFFRKGGFSVTVEVSNPQENLFSAKIKTDEPKILIGQSGQILMEIQHLLRIIVKKSLEKEVNLDLDINDYKKKKFEYLKDIARSSADEVFLSKSDKELDPMPSYERRIIHMELANRSDVLTESIGEGESRRVVIRAK